MGLSSNHPHCIVALVSVLLPSTFAILHTPCSCLFVCVFIHVCMSTREHWGAFRQHEASSFSSVWSCWNSELGPAASSHISSATWEKNKTSAPLIFYSVPAGRRHVDLTVLAPSPWNQVTALATASWTQHTRSLATHTHTCTHHSLCTATTAWPWLLFLWLCCRFNTNSNMLLGETCLSH